MGKVAQSGAKEGVWQRIANSPFGTAYAGEVYWLARGAAESLAQLLDEAGTPPEDGSDFIRVDAGFHNRLISTLAMAARIRWFVQPRNRRDASESQQEILDGRTAMLRDMLDGIDLEPVMDASLRNSLEHFDEYLDDMALASAEGKIRRPTLFPMDMALSRRSALHRFQVGGNHPTIHHLRVFVCDEQVFVNAGREVNVDTLQQVCAEIADRLAALVGPTQDDERGAHILVVTEASFSKSNETT